MENLLREAGMNQTEIDLATHELATAAQLAAKHQPITGVELEQLFDELGAPFIRLLADAEREAGATGEGIRHTAG